MPPALFGLRCLPFCGEVAQAGETTNECGIGHLPHLVLIFLRTFDDREVDAIVDINIIDLHSQASSVATDVANRQMEITDHLDLRLLLKPLSYPSHDL